MRVTRDLPVRVLPGAPARAYRLCDGVWEQWGEKRSGNEFKLATEKKDGKCSDLQVRIGVEHPTRIATEAGKTRRLHLSPDS